MKDSRRGAQRWENKKRRRDSLCLGRSVRQGLCSFQGYAIRDALVPEKKIHGILFKNRRIWSRQRGGMAGLWLSALSGVVLAQEEYRDFSLLYTEEEYTQWTQKSPTSGPSVDRLRRSSQKSNGFSPPPDHLHFGGLIYEDSQTWTVWINGVAFQASKSLVSQESNEEEAPLTLHKVTLTMVEVQWHVLDTSAATTPHRCLLRLNQSYCRHTRKILEGSHPCTCSPNRTPPPLP